MDKRKDKDQDTYKHDCQDQAGDQGVWSPFISGEGPEFEVSIEQITHLLISATIVHDLVRFPPSMLFGPRFQGRVKRVLLRYIRPCER